MIGRRDFVLGATCVVAASIGRSATAQTNPVAATAPGSNMPASEQLMYSTVRLSSQVGGKLHWGTGFLFHFFNMGGVSVPALVTNHHVISGLEQCTILLPGKRPDGSPDLEHHIPVQIDDIQKRAIFHSSADLAIVPFGEFFVELERKKQGAFIIGLDQSLIPTEDEIKSLTPVEQILTVGYPGQLWDDVHNLPVFHRGYTSTAPYVDFQGRREFLIDVATWPGTSGSPVMLFNEGGYTDRKQNITFMGATRTKLLGVVYGVGTQDVSGNVLVQAAPTQILLPAQMSVPTNLGACIDASRILEFEPMLMDLGVKPPEGYVVRAK